MLSTRRKYHTILPLILYICFKQFCQKQHDVSASILKSDLALSRRIKIRVPWSIINERISDIHFRRMFRMTRQCFDELCSKIRCSIGERAFLSEKYIDAFMSDDDISTCHFMSTCRLSRMYRAHCRTSGGFISGEMKLAITIRMLAGWSPLDLAILFDVSESHCKTLFIKVLKNWIIQPNIGKIDIESYLSDDAAMKRVAIGFSRQSGGILKGAIGAIDGWLVKITRPWKFRDGITNPASFFSRKGFYALNVQCMVDHEKSTMGILFKPWIIS